MRLMVFLGVIILSSILLPGCNNNSDKRLVGINPDEASNDSLLEGEKSVYAKNGKLRYIVEYKKGIANGRVREFYEDGKIYMDAIYKDGHRNGKCSLFFKNGKPFSVLNYVNGEKDGIETKFYGNGNCRAITVFRKGKAQPGLKEYKQDGTEIKQNVKLLIQEIDHTALEGKYYIRVSLSVPRKNVKYYASPLSDPDSREKLKISGASGILEVPVSANGFVMKKLIFDAEYTTQNGNMMRLQKSYNLAIDR
jgi:hypothetical protein